MITQSFSIGSINIDGGRDRPKQVLLFSLMTIDVLIPYEIHATPADESDQAYDKRVHLFSVMALTLVLGLLSPLDLMLL